VEAGGDLVYGVLGIATLGVRVSPWPAVNQNPKVQFLNDLEMGFGLGVGGEFECDEEKEDCVSDGLDWEQRFAYGGYVGTGIGVGFTHWKGSNHVLDFDIYARVRMSFAKAEGAPYTTWIVWGPGIQIRINRIFRLWYMYPFSHHWNGHERMTGWYFGEIGLGFDFDLISSS
jgi:hypothetical protein